MPNKVGETYQRPWGNYITLALADGYQVKMLTVNPGGQLSLQKHQQRSERWAVVQGKPTITVDKTVKEYAVGDIVHVPCGSQHRLENFTEQTVLVLELQLGTYLGEDDIERLEDVYDRRR